MSFLLAALGIIALVILHEFGHFAVAKAVGMRVERFSLFFPPLLLRKKRGETEYAIGALPLGGYVKISGMNPDEELPDEVRTRAYYAQPVWKRISVILAGPAMNFLIAFVLLLAFFWLIGAQTISRDVGIIERGFPAATALEPGDKLIAVDGERGSPAELSQAIAAHRCAGVPSDGCRAEEPATLLIERDGERKRLTLTPVYDAEAERTRLGFGFAPGPRQTLAFGEAFDVTTERYWFITKATASLPARLIDPEQREELTGIVGAFEVTRQTIVDDIENAVGIIAVISLSLAIVNLFPFLPLDGGHVFWGIVEKVRRRPVPFSVMERSGVIGFMLVALLFVIGFTNDIERLSGEGFDVR